MSAGADQATVEEQDVTIDGSATRDPDGDTLSYQWTLVSAPAGSAVTVAADTPSFSFRPDLPGDYELRLTASDGAQSGADTVRVTADALFTIGSPAGFKIDGGSRTGSDRKELALTSSARYAGPPVSFTATSSAPWLTVPASGSLARGGSSARLALQLNPAELSRMENGSHQARVTIAPDGGWTGASADITLELALPEVRLVSPYVAYAGQSARVTLWGSGLAKADGKSLFIGGAEATDIEASSDTRATIDLPPLAAGTHTVRIGHDLDIRREMARVVVRNRPQYRDAAIGLEGPVRAFEYDAERDAIYLVLESAGGQHKAIRLRHDGTGAWSRDELPISPPRFDAKSALALSADGEELFITSDPCTVHRVDPDTLAVLESSAKQPCPAGAMFHDIAPLADGRVILTQVIVGPAPGADPSGGPPDDELFEFPGYGRAEGLPRGSHLFFVRDGARDRLLLVEPHRRIETSTVASGSADVYDLGGEARRAAFRTPPEEFWRGNVSMDADGSRTLHSTNLYDAGFKLLGRLAGADEYVIPGTAINASGTRAVVLDELDIRVHDLTVPGGVFPMIGTLAPLPPEARGFFIPQILHVPPSGGAVFTIVSVNSSPWGAYGLYVRASPLVTR